MKLVAPAACAKLPALTRARAADWLELTKPRVAVLVLFTVGIGAILAERGVPDLLMLFHTLCGTALVAAGASALNQWLERRSDGRMLRTENRPLPGGRLLPAQVMIFGFGLGVIGMAYLAIALHRPLAALVAGVTFVSYVFIYTPLKRKTPLNTLVGAIPGALPPVIGWTAVRGTIDVRDWPVLILFLILFFWQVPHFLAIAWIYREDYARAGLRMLPVVDRRGDRTSRSMVGYCLALVLVSLILPYFGLGGVIYLAGAAAFGFCFLIRTLSFRNARTNSQARRVLRYSLLYLPSLFALLAIDQLLSGMVVGFWR